MNVRTLMVLGALPLAAAGCFTVKTESEVKPIHITLDVNLKVDKEIDRAFSDENIAKPKGDFAEVKRLLDSHLAGISNQAMLEARSGASDDEKIFIAEANMRRVKRFEEIAKTSGVTVAAVRARSLKKFEEKVPAGSKIWIQRPDGTWYQK